MFEKNHVLLVDDDKDLRDRLAEYLRREGLAVNTAAGPVAARALLAQQVFNLIVLESSLPGEDGFSLCHDVIERTGTPVILLSAMADPASRIAGLDSGADDYLIKPFDPLELVARINTVLRRMKRAARVPSTTPIPLPVKRYVLEIGGWISKNANCATPRAHESH